MCKFFNSYEESLHLGVCKLAKYVRTALFSGKIYTSDKNFTRPPVATVATNSKSGNLLGWLWKTSAGMTRGGTVLKEHFRKTPTHTWLTILRAPFLSYGSLLRFKNKRTRAQKSCWNLTVSKTPILVAAFMLGPFQIFLLYLPIPSNSFDFRPFNCSTSARAGIDTSRES